MNNYGIDYMDNYISLFVYESSLLHPLFYYGVYDIHVDK